MTERIQVGVSPPEYFDSNTRLLRMLENLFPVRIEPRPEECSRFGDASIVLGVDRATAIAKAQPESPCIAFLDTTERDDRPARRQSTFASASEVTPALRGRSLEELSAPHGTQPTALSTDDTVLAVRDGRPAWMARHGARSQCQMYISAVPLPKLTDRDYLVDFLGRNESMGLVPIFDFLRRLTNPIDWQVPAPRACVVFDDVNMRDPSYGCLEFPELAAHASSNGYHAAIAMIPLDAKRACAGAVSLFRGNPRHLSILVHGNNHQHLELARSRPPAERHALLSQALTRSAAFGATHGLSVDPVMEPPYGTVHVDYLGPLAEAGFESVLVTPRQFRRINAASAQTAFLGMAATETWPNGLGVIPRITADACWRNDVLIASFLRQPIVVAGHHFDADSDLRWVDEIARFVNSVQTHSWCSPSTIARSQYTWRRTGSVAHVKCFSRAIDFPVPEGVDSVVVERPWLDQAGLENMRLSSAQGESAAVAPVGRVYGPVAVGPHNLVRIRSAHPRSAFAEAAALPATGYNLRLRRAITETSDRFYPQLPRSFRRKSAIMAKWT